MLGRREKEPEDQIVLTGSQALGRALAAARVRAAWSYPGAPLLKLGLLLDGGGAKGLAHRYAVNDHAAVSMALGGALLHGNATAVLLKHLGIGSTLEALGTFGVVNELRSGCLIIEGVDPAPVASHNAQDNRTSLVRIGHLLQLEAAAPDELYHFTRLAKRVSERCGMPVVLRVGARGLDAEGDPGELPPDPLHGESAFSRAAGPLVCTAATYRYHVDKRRRRLRQLAPFIDALALRVGDGGARGVVIAGHLGARIQSLVSAHGLPSLRLGTSFPLPRKPLIEFLRGKSEVLVLEEGEGVLEEALLGLAHREGIAVTVRGAEGARPLALDEERAQRALAKFCAKETAIPDGGPRDSAAWKRISDTVDAIGEDDGEPWPLYVARLRRSMKGFVADDRRALLLEILRKLDRPTIIVGDPGNISVLGIRDRLVDVKMHMGSAASIAGAMSEAAEVEERVGAPLAVALMADTNLYHSGLLGLIDNAVAKREVLHVIVATRNPSAVRPPALSEDALEAALRGTGVHVSTVALADPDLPNAISYAAQRVGPRVLLCIAEVAAEPADE
jgi:indolepyruvate ferredoxin oxidoreductase alpha subunit